MQGKNPVDNLLVLHLALTSCRILSGDDATESTGVTYFVIVVESNNNDWIEVRRLLSRHCRQEYSNTVVVNKSLSIMPIVLAQYSGMEARSTQDLHKSTRSATA